MFKINLIFEMRDVIQTTTRGFTNISLIHIDDDSVIVPIKFYNQDPDLTEGDTNQLIDEVRLLFSFF